MWLIVAPTSDPDGTVRTSGVIPQEPAAMMSEGRTAAEQTQGGLVSKLGPWRTYLADDVAECFPETTPKPSADVRVP